MRINKPVIGITGIASGTNGNIPLPVGRRYHTVQLITTLAGVATIASSVLSRVRVVVNETGIWDVSVARLLKFNAAIGLPDPDGVLTLHFSRPDLADITNEEATAFDTFDEGSFRIETTQLVVANPGVAAECTYDFKRNVAADGRTPAKMIVRLNELTESFPLGTKDWTTLNKTRPILRAWLDGASAISKVEVIVDDLTVFDSTAVDNVPRLANYGIDGTLHKFPVCFNYTNRMDDGLMVGNSLNFKITSAAAQDITALMETLSFNYNAA